MSWSKNKILLLITCLLSIAIIVCKDYAIVKSNTYSNTNLKKQTQSNVVFDFEAYCETIEDEVKDQDQEGFTKIIPRIIHIIHASSFNTRYHLSNNKFLSENISYIAFKDLTYLAFIGSYRI
jgi:hypothetical protein